MNSTLFLLGISLATFLLGLFSCVQQPTIGLNEHQFNYVPEKVIYFFLPGLDYSQVEFGFVDAGVRNVNTVYRRSVCLGQSINYNLNELRPDPLSVLLMQLSGKINQDAKECSVWEGPLFVDKFKRNLKSNRDVPFFWIESGVKLENSFLKSAQCESKEKWTNFVGYFLLNHDMQERELKSVSLQPYRMWGQPGRPTAGMYQESSCQKSGCSNSKKEILLNFLQKLGSDKRYAVLWTDYDLLNALSQKQWKRVYQIEKEYEELINAAVDVSSSDALILVTSANSLPIVYPTEGNAWKEMEQKQGPAKTWNWIQNHASLGSPVFSFGASAENFCGIYESSEVYYRIVRGLDYGK